MPRSLPAASADAQAAFDKYGNLFLSYLAGPLVQFGNKNGDNTPTTFNDTTRSWADGEWIHSSALKARHKFFSLHFP